MIIKNKIKLFLIVLYIILIAIKFKKNIFEINLIRYIKFKKQNLEIKNYEERLMNIIIYIEYLKEKNNEEEIYYNEIKKTKISFITTVYNQENYLSTFIYSVQKQDLKEFELIFVDDFSSDSSSKIIKKRIEKDKRIKLIKNKRNMGTLYSRFIGQINSKSDYILFIDCDDIILKTGIIKSYNHIINYNLDIVQFHAVFQTKNNISINTIPYKYQKIIYNPILSYIFYYNINKGDELNFALWDKLIKKTIVLKAFKFIGAKYLKKKIIIHNDLIILFSLLQIASSYQYINEIGYYYIKTNKNSATNSWNIPTKINQIIHSLFTNINFLYEKTNNSILVKYYCVFKVEHYFSIYNTIFKYINNEEYYYIKKILNKLLNSIYISLKDKLKIKKIEILIKKMKDTYHFKL